jgi:hypothetical protein
MKKVIALTAGAMLAGCAQMGVLSDKIDDLCAKARPLAFLAMPLPVVGPYVAAGVEIGCGTAEGLARLRADANSAVWLAEQIGILREALKR